jgi:membrane protein DedA with SNARE-associated domain
MVRLAGLLKALLVLGLALHVRHHLHGPPIDYAGLAAAAAASWAGLPGPGEPVLIAAGIFAAKHRLDIGEVIVIAWLAAAAGGVAGWLIGMKAGRTVLTARGPLWKARTRALARGDAIFTRHPLLAIILTPSWIAGIHRVGSGVYLTTNVVTAALWAVGIGLGAYYAGPAVIDVANDVGLLTTIGLVGLVALVVAAEVLRRRRRNEEEAPVPPVSTPERGAVDHS